MSGTENEITQREENAAAHIQQSDTIMHMKEQIGGLENRLSRAQDMLAEMQNEKVGKEHEGKFKKCETCKHNTTPAPDCCDGCGQIGKVSCHWEAKKPATRAGKAPAKPASKKPAKKAL